MTLTASKMLPLGTLAPDFTLQDTRTGENVSLSEMRSDIATVIFFICNHCPFVRHIHAELLKTALNYQKKGIAFIGISSNDVSEYPEDGPEQMRERAKAHQYTFPYLYDETQQVAKAYQAACTPDFFVFDKNLKLVYRGRFDAATPTNDIPVTGEDLHRALGALLENKSLAQEQLPSFGCNIKWKGKKFPLG